MNQPALFMEERSRYLLFSRQNTETIFGTLQAAKSLKTDSLRFAVKLARAYRVELDKEMEKLKEGVYSALSVTLEGRTTSQTGLVTQGYVDVSEAYHQHPLGAADFGQSRRKRR